MRDLSSEGSRSLEAQYLRVLADHANGNPDAQLEAHRLAMAAANSGDCRELLTGLIAAVSVDNREIQVSACCALASLGVDAEPAIAALKACALSGSEAGAPAAAAALGQIPVEPAARALVEVIEEFLGEDFKVLEVAFLALRNHAERLAPYMARLEGSYGVLPTYFAGICAMAMDRIREVVQRVQVETAERLQLPGFFDLNQLRRGAELSRGDGAIELRDVPRGDAKGGVVIDERFRFSLGERSEIRLRLFRNRTDAERFIVVLSEDADSYGVNIAKAIAPLANALYMMYQLDPKKITWVRHLAPESGRTQDNRDEYSVVRFEKFDRRTGLLSEPRWSRTSSLKELL
jgi:hypothetical protein